MSFLRALARRLFFAPLVAIAGDQQRFLVAPVIRGPARGLRFKLDPLKGGENAYWLGRYDPAILRTLVRICEPGWTVWDVGCHIGFYSAFFSRLVGPSGQVVAFEPHPVNFERARLNIERNRLRNVTLLNEAVGPPVSSIDFVLSGSTTSHLYGTYVGSRPPDPAISEQHQRISVPSISLDEALTERNLPTPQLIKMDIEGAEREALRYFNCLDEVRRPLILLELHNPECDAEAWQFACRFGYAIHEASTGQRILNGSNVSGTVLLLPHNLPASRRLAALA